MEYRNELKYLINIQQEEILKTKLYSAINLDDNSKSKNGYLIRSLYFDDYFDNCFYENENGVDVRSKYRIRLYNGNLDKLNFEIKHKEHNFTSKEACEIDTESVKKIIDGENIDYSICNTSQLRKLYILETTKHLKPKIIVEYDRIPFVYKDGNVRITIDKSLRSTDYIEEFLNKEIKAKPILPKGASLLEIKFDGFIPKYIYDLLNIGNLEQTTFSKYYLCRKYGGYRI